MGAICYSVFTVTLNAQLVLLCQARPELGMTPMGSDKGVECYGAADLQLGSCIDIHGRSFWLYDCDAFTRQYCLVRLFITSGNQNLTERS